jgi:hypothetical protein
MVRVAGGPRYHGAPMGHHLSGAGSIGGVRADGGAGGSARRAARWLLGCLLRSGRPALARWHGRPTRRPAGAALMRSLTASDRIRRLHARPIARIVARARGRACCGRIRTLRVEDPAGRCPARLVPAESRVRGDRGQAAGGSLVEEPLEPGTRHDRRRQDRRTAVMTWYRLDLNAAPTPRPASLAVRDGRDSGTNGPVSGGGAGVPPTPAGRAAGRSVPPGAATSRGPGSRADATVSGRIPCLHAWPTARMADQVCGRACCGPARARTDHRPRLPGSASRPFQRYLVLERRLQAGVRRVRRTPVS